MNQLAIEIGTLHGAHSVTPSAMIAHCFHCLYHLQQPCHSQGLLTHSIVSLLHRYLLMCTLLMVCHDDLCFCVNCHFKASGMMFFIFHWHVEVVSHWTIGHSFDITIFCSSAKTLCQLLSNHFSVLSTFQFTYERILWNMGVLIIYRSFLNL
jgi:hypothetical protein